MTWSGVENQNQALLLRHITYVMPFSHQSYPNKCAFKFLIFIFLSLCVFRFNGLPKKEMNSHKLQRNFKFSIERHQEYVNWEIIKDCLHSDQCLFGGFIILLSLKSAIIRKREWKKHDDFIHCENGSM